LREIAVTQERDAGRDQRVGKVAARRDAQPRVLQPGALALFRPEALIGQRLIDQGGRDLALAIRHRLLDRDRNREMRDAVKEVRGAVERVDDEARLVGIAGDLTALLGQDRPVRPRLAQFLDQRLLGTLVGHRDEIGRPLAADLEVLNLVEVAAQARRCLARGALDDGEWEGNLSLQ
jgi:hypothetical protein